MLLKDPDFRFPSSETIPVPNGYQNPLFPDMPDPSVVYDQINGYYYCTRPQFDDQGKGIAVCRGKTLSALIREKKVVFYVTPETGLYDCAWASELHRIGERWYIYASASCHPTEGYIERKMRTFVLESKTGDPFDGFDFAGILGANEAAIDATVLQHTNGRLYLCFSRLFEEDRQKLMLQEMASPTQLTGKPVCISRAVYPWERIAPYDGKECINEGPFFIRHDGRTFCIYSFNGCWCDDYGLGILELTGNDPMAPGAWEKDDTPWLTKGEDMFAPGHASFFCLPNKQEWYIAYHVVLEHNPTYIAKQRDCCIQQIFFDKTGFPHIGAPSGLTRVLPWPDNRNI